MRGFLCLGAATSFVACADASGVPPSNTITQIPQPTPGSSGTSNGSVSLDMNVVFHIPFVPDPNDIRTPAGMTLSPLINPNECVDVPNGTSAIGTHVQLWDCNGYAAAQTWQWSQGQLSAQAGTVCLDIVGDDVVLASHVAIAACDPTHQRVTQQWAYRNGLLEVATSGRCLALGDTTGQRGIPLTLKNCAIGDPSQRWGLDHCNGPFVRGAMIGTSVSAYKCMDVVDSNPADGTPVQIFDCNASPAQQWVLEGLFLHALGLGKCIEVTGNSGLLDITDCANVPSQQWIIQDGQIQQASSVLCITLPNGDTTNTTRLAVAPCASMSNQQWIFGGVAP